MQVICTEIVDGVHKNVDYVVKPLEMRDFSIASFLMMEDLTNTSDARFSVDVMLEWFKHDGNSDFSIQRTESGGRISYLWEYEA